jgi:predicted GH43/DUF377 family glycosyl hydrolase
MAIRRHSGNPIIAPADVRPTRDDFEVVCAFNAGAIRHGSQIILLLRVAERPLSDSPNHVAFPYLSLENGTAGLKVVRIRKDDPDLEMSDPRGLQYKGKPYLTSISHLRVARSGDGRNFAIDRAPLLFPHEYYETYGTEDPRLTWLDGRCYIDYVGVSEHGIATCLASTRDFKSAQRHGLIFLPANRDVAIFPEKINGRYAAFCRPMPAYIGSPEVWLAWSTDLIHWGEYEFVLGPTPGTWDAGRVGGGAPPFKTPRGWLEIYHAANPDDFYCLGAMLTELDRPARIIARSRSPLMSPEADYEMRGFYGHVVFTCGCVPEPDGTVRIYYGAADTVTCLAETTVDEIIATLR